MIYTETLLSLDKVVEDAFAELVTLANTNQKNDNDILLIFLNGWRNTEYEAGLRSRKISPFMIGSGIFGHCFHSFYEFYDVYRKGAKYKSEITPEEKQKEDFKIQEKISIDLELMIYLKFWESDIILFKLYNLVQLALGESYDWNLHNGIIGQRRKLIKDHIQAPIKDLCPKLFELIEDTYSNQIRNSIAHSKYYHAGRTLQLGNKSENSRYILSSIPYDEWEIRFHKVLLIFNHLINTQNKINQEHIEKVRNKHWGLSITIPEKTDLGLNKVFWLKYNFEINDWYWNSQK